MNLWIVIPLAIVITALVVPSVVGYAIRTEDDIEIEYKQRDELLAVLKRAKWRLYALTGDPCENVRIIYPPYDWAEEE